MNRPLVLTAAVITALLVAAIAVRLRDTPYIAFVNGQRADATEELRQKAERGDGFAALLVARNYSRGVMGAFDREKAIDWYLTAARFNEIRAIVPFIDLTLTPSTATPDRCRIAVPLLDLVARTGEVPALVTLSHYYKTGLCVEADLAMATRYYMSAARIDPRFYKYAESQGIDLHQARELTPSPEKFDVKQSIALTQFLAAAPALR